jgi:hypothetical protein
MATQLIRKDPKSKSNWMRLLKAAELIEFEDGKLIAGKGWKIYDMDATRISIKLSQLEVEHEVVDNYNVIIN